MCQSSNFNKQLMEIGQQKTKEDYFQDQDEFDRILEEKQEILSDLFEENFTNEAPQRKLSGNKRGRPKGEKNSKKKEKKVKQSFHQQNSHKGHWSREEKNMYHWFLEIHHENFICKEMRRLDRIFKLMSSFIGTRQAEQCRSHHQKMEKKYSTFPRIMLELRRSSYGTEECGPIYEDILRQLKIEEIKILSDRKLKQLDVEKQLSVQVSSTLIETEQMEESDFFLGPKQIVLDLLGNDYEEQFELRSFLSSFQK